MPPRESISAHQFSTKIDAAAKLFCDDVETLLTDTSERARQPLKTVSSTKEKKNILYRHAELWRIGCLGSVRALWRRLHKAILEHPEQTGDPQSLSGRLPDWLHATASRISDAPFQDPSIFRSWLSGAVAKDPELAADEGLHYEMPGALRAILCARLDEELNRLKRITILGEDPAVEANEMLNRAQEVEKRPGRPKVSEEVRKRAAELARTKSWKGVAEIMNRETGFNKSAESYRKLARSHKAASGN